jgi:hypothetical protein
MSDNKRNEGQLLQDILGLESLVDEITYTLANEATDQPTATAVSYTSPLPTPNPTLSLTLTS